MSSKPGIKEVIIVEGRYDKNTVSQAVDAVILETGGFNIFSQKEKLDLIRRMAEKRGVIIFTDSDSAGFLIRNHLKGAIPGGLVKHAYIPDVEGKERRKRTPSKEGKLGVEGMERDVIVDCLRRAGASFEGEESGPTPAGDAITSADLYELGLSGRPGSAEKRREILRKLDLPENVSSGAFPDVLSAVCSLQELQALIDGTDRHK